jgi:hypothetical protein
MSSFFFYSTKAGQKRVLWLEAATEIATGGEAEVTENPVEEGADLADHMRVKRPKIELTFRVSNEPIYTYQNLRGVVPEHDKFIGAKKGGYRESELTYKQAPKAASLSNAIDAAAGALVGLFVKTKPLNKKVLRFDSPFNLVTEIGDELRAIQANAIRGTLYTTTRIYESVVLQAFAEVRNKEFGTGAEFKVTFKEIAIATAVRTKAPSPAVVKANQPKALGKQGTPDAAQKPEGSLLAAGVKKLGIFD